jgi:Trk K+ transport system NAD-binding subunit
MLNESQTASGQTVLICGLGRLGQHCAVLLKELGVPVFGLTDIALVPEVEGMPGLLDRLTVGDCRRHSALEEAGINSCRAVLLTTSDERVNVSAALAARALNPEIRIVVRSSQTNLNDLLHQSLANLIALDIAELPATAFAMAAIGDETVGLFSVDGQILRVVENRITSTHRWHECVELHDLNTLGRRVLHRTSSTGPEPIDFHGWDPADNLTAGDVVVCIELNQPSLHVDAHAAGKKTVGRIPRLSWSSIRARITRAWTAIHQTYRLAAVVAVMLLLLHVTGVVLYRRHYPEVSLFDAFNVATVLIFDGYSNMFAQLKLPFPIPLWLLLFSLAMTMAGAVVMGILYAFLTARVLSARLNFRRRHGRIPDADHIVIVGMGPLGRRVAELLSSLGHAVVGITEKELDPGVLPNVPVLTTDLRQGLQKANCQTAASVAVLTMDDIANLEIGLLALRMNQDCNLVIRTDDAEFGRNVKALAPHTQAMSVYALSAEAYVAATLGDKILSLLRIGTQTALAIEYSVDAGDRMEGQLIADVTYGYGLVAIMYQRNPSSQAQFFPSEDIRLEVGSRLVVLATIGGLQNFEHGVSAERAFRIRILRAASHDAEFEGARIIARVTGCELGTARTQLNQLPATLNLGLFRQQASRLVRELNTAGMEAEVLSSKD